IGDKVVITAYSAIESDLPGDQAYGGIPARPLSIMRRYWMSQTKLPELLKRVKKLESAIEKLNESSADN
ncbi:MAG: UDP-3-O-(3-hydroxymyristoyl)glucosamine N-acyltransferase, partial [Phycisphaerae bacterium]|nr:UDP-3-O-(3-hydroxymyristoyl)glucosamine N-acyltransferase [Phycisphaerae bacterium]